MRRTGSSVGGGGGSTVLTLSTIGPILAPGGCGRRLATGGACLWCGVFARTFGHLGHQNLDFTLLLCTHGDTSALGAHFSVPWGGGGWRWLAVAAVVAAVVAVVAAVVAVVAAASASRTLVELLQGRYALHRVPELTTRARHG